MKEKKQIIDSVTELQPEAKTRGRTAPLANPLNSDTAIITTKQQYLPRSSVVMRLLEIREDPLAYFMPTKNSSGVCAPPPGLAPELSELFTRLAPLPTYSKRKAPSQVDSPSKRSRKEDDIEVARRAESIVPSEGIDFNIEQPHLEDLQFGDQPGPIDDFRLETPEAAQNLGRDKSVLSDRSRLSSVAPGGEFEDRMTDSTCPVAVFDSQPSQTQSNQSAEREEELESPEFGKGYSKNTLKALSIIRRELSGDESDPAKIMSFEQTTNKVCLHCLLVLQSFLSTLHQASRRAASSFFFELLVLGTRDCIQVRQPSSFSDIQVAAKARLWDHHQQHPDIEQNSAL